MTESPSFLWWKDVSFTSGVTHPMITRYSGSYSTQRFILKKTSRNLPGLFGKFRVVASTWWQPENWYCPNLLAALQVLSRWHAITDIGKFRGLGWSCCPLNNDASVMGACGCQLWVKSWKRKSYSPGVTLNCWHSMPGWAWDPSVTTFGVAAELLEVSEPSRLKIFSKVKNNCTFLWQ